MKRFNVNSLDEVYAGVGSGDLRINQVVNYINSVVNKLTKEEEDQQLREKLEHGDSSSAPKKPRRDAVVVEGVDNLMTHLARCCQPIPGDDIEGYVTQGRGISVHRADCEQLAELRHHAPERIIDTVWGGGYIGSYQITVRVSASERSGLIKDLNSVLTNEKVKVSGMQSRVDYKQQMSIMDFDLELSDLEVLGRVIARLEQVKDVHQPSGCTKQHGQKGKLVFPFFLYGHQRLQMKNMSRMQELLEIMATLRDPENGCSWDKKQTFDSIIPYTIEETFETVDAIERQNWADVRDELGDLLFQIVFYSQLGKEQGLFDFEDIAGAMCDKLVRRHPHVFGDKDEQGNPLVEADWEGIKAAERAAKAKPEEPLSILDDVPTALPALGRASKLQKRCAVLGLTGERLGLWLKKCRRSSKK